MHRRGLIHRDLKSANVLVMSDGRVKLIDFGTAKIENPMEEITGEGEFVGTYAYASPEQLRGKPLTRRSDMYNLGVLFYRMFTGKLPFYGDGVYDIARQHVEVMPTPPVERVSGLPVGLSELIMQMLEKRPKRRPRSMVNLVEGLDRIIGDAEIPSLLPDLDVPAERIAGRSATACKGRGLLNRSRIGTDASCNRRSWLWPTRILSAFARAGKSEEVAHSNR